MQAEEVEWQKIEESDLGNLVGEWTGTLIYRDYKTNKPYSMPCDLVLQLNGNKTKAKLRFTYPDEPGANSKDKIAISKDRTTINGHAIVSRSTNAEGEVEVVTEYAGKDGNEGKMALIRNTFLISNNRFVMSKAVQFVDSDEWIKRNEYEFTRK